MVFACTLINCEPGKYSKVVEELRKLKQVKRAFEVHGRWDVVAEVKVADLEALGDVALRINGLEGVMASETLIGFQEV